MSENILEVRHLKKYFPTKRGLLHACLLYTSDAADEL